MTFPASIFTSSAPRRNLAAVLLAGGLFCFSACAPSARSAGGPGASAPLTEEESADALRLAQESKLELQTQSSRLKELEGQVRDLTEILSWTAERVQAQERSLDSLRRGASSAGSASPAPSAAGADGAPTRITPDEATLYRQALDQYFGRNYDAALKAFTDLQTRYPQGAYADNAEYWIGESRFGKGDFAGAAASFRKVFTYAGTEKGDDAQLKLGYCYLRLGDRKRAGEEFWKLVSSYPSSEYIDRAQAELDKLKAE
jgi:tol-pal system protein YbgF